MSRSLLLLAAACILTPARAQITITHADYEAALNIQGINRLYSTESSAALNAIAAQTGGNQTWDFTGLTYDPEYVTTVTRVQPPIPGSDDPHLAQATHFFRIESQDSTIYTFQGLSATQGTFLGLTGPSILMRFVPPQVSIVLPLTFGATWASTYETQLVPGFPAGVTLMTEDVNNVVGWGNLVTPAGSAPALMIRTETTNTLTFPPLPPIITTSTAFLFTAYGQLNANIFVSSGSPTSGDYNVYPGGTANAPDPAESTLRLQVEGSHPVTAGRDVRVAYTLAAPARTRIEVFDALGRRMGDLVDGAERGAGVHHAVWTGPAMAPGVYLARLSAGAQSASLAFTIIR